MKKLIRLVLSLLMCSLAITPIQAEPDYSDSGYWNSRCTGKSNMSAADKEACTGYAKYLQSQNTDLAKQLTNIEAQRAAVAADIAYYGAQISEYQKQIDAKQVEINAKQAQIDAKQAEIDAIQVDIDKKQAEIDAKQKEIDATQAEVDELKGKVKDRMTNSQPTMRTNRYTDILMGADTFEEFLRILNGLNAIAQYDKVTLDDLVVLVAKLNKQKEEMRIAREEMKAKQKEMEEAKEEMEEEKDA